MDFIRLLADPGPVAKIQRFCGVDYERPITCDQQTQTRRDSSDSSSGEKSEHISRNGRTCSHNSPLPEGRSSKSNISNVDIGNIPGSLRTERIFGLDCPAREHNNNGNVTRIKEISSEYAQTEITNRKTRESIKNNYCQINEPSNKCYLKPTNFEYSGNSANIKSSKEEGDDDVTMETDITPASSPVPVVRIKYRSLLYLARFGAFLGNELFYLTFFPFIIWNLDALIVRQVSMLWCVVMYIGQATKDYLRWPRPRCPPVIRLEVHYTREYSMPSTHAMAGTAIPLYLAYLSVERYQVPVYVAGPIALFWFSVTCWSRLYLGVHSILDLLVGCVYALAIFFTFLGYVEGYDLYQQTHPFGAPVLLFTALTLCTVLYPTHHKNSSKADAVQIVSAYTGLGIGSWLGYQLGYMHESDIAQPYSIAVPTLSWCVMALLRFITGVGVLGFLYAVTKWWSVRFFSYIYGLDEPDKTYPGVMTAYKFTTYAVVGAGAALFAPLLHLHLNIHRPALFYEVL